MFSSRTGIVVPTILDSIWPLPNYADAFGANVSWSGGEGR
jgi:hypothetical protein